MASAKAKTGTKMRFNVMATVSVQSMIEIAAADWSDAVEQMQDLKCTDFVEVRGELFDASIASLDNIGRIG